MPVSLSEMMELSNGDKGESISNFTVMPHRHLALASQELKLGCVKSAEISVTRMVEDDLLDRSISKLRPSLPLPRLPFPCQPTHWKSDGLMDLTLQLRVFDYS